MTRPGEVKRNPSDQAIAELKEILADRLSTAEAVRRHHGNDIMSWHDGMAPDAVAFVQTTCEVASIVKICGKYSVPVIAYGTGTSLEGHISAPFGGISIDMQQMNQVLEVNQKDLDCRVQAGVTRKQLNEHLRDTGMFFPIDPGADASIGGMTATRASGTNAVRYGTMRENVLSITAVMADGEIIRTARRAKKSAAGYDLTHLLVGSEGTLGVITEVSLKLYGIPESIASGICSFPDVESACNTAIKTIQIGLPIARIELVDSNQIVASNSYSDLNLPVLPHLFLEFHGTSKGVNEQIEMFAAIGAETGGGKFKWATKTEERNHLWQARHDALHAAKAMYPGLKAFVTDVCVPISRLAECVSQAREELDKRALPGVTIGHVGDGNFHIQIFVDPSKEAEMAKCEEFLEALVFNALAMEGTCTGEHGIGLGKMKFLQAEHGHGLKVMRQIKAALDPKNIMNPGKIVLT